MNRNLDRRVEVLFPIEDERIKERIAREILEPSLSDNVKMRWLQMNGSYERPRAAEEKEFNLQDYLLEPALIA
jgi:polyphosphate kinase